MKNATSRDLMKACAKYILGESTGVKIKGKLETLGALQDALTASRDLYNALCERRSLQDIRVLAEKKSKAARRFREITGIAWVL